MRLRPVLFLRSLVVVGVASSLASGCINTVTAFDHHGDGTCTTPEPPSEGWCPPAWTCVEGEWLDTAGACPDPCPVERPNDGEDCEAVGAICNYEEHWYGDCEDPEGPVDVKVQCTDQGWTTISTHCQPPPDCPDDPPIAGTDCSGWDHAYSCSYPVPSSCGTLWMDAFCEWTGEDQVWVASIEESCELDCQGFGEPAGCEASPACRWLEPGCDTGGIPGVTGCFDEAPCAADGCGDGASCTVVTHDPCWNQSCDSCAAETTVCLADDSGA